MDRNPYDCIFSIGYRCSSAGILKSLGLKTESYPFDWLVSRLPIIEHCVKTEFKSFLNPDNYRCGNGATNNYSSLDPSSAQWICDESICVNDYYERIDLPNIDLYLPNPISPERDAYGNKIMMNHHNIKNSKPHQEYFARCIDRWNRLWNRKKTLSLYIHPATFHSEFLSIKPRLIKDIRGFHHFMTFYNRSHEGIYIIPVKTQYEYPTNHCCKYVLEEQPDDPNLPGCRICILWTNRDFVDAGEIFMGNSYVETYVVKDYLEKTVDNKGLLVNSSVSTLGV